MFTGHLYEDRWVEIFIQVPSIFSKLHFIPFGVDLIQFDGIVTNTLAGQHYRTDVVRSRNKIVFLVRHAICKLRLNSCSVTQELYELRQVLNITRS